MDSSENTGIYLDRDDFFTILWFLRQGLENVPEVFVGSEAHLQLTSTTMKVESLISIAERIIHNDDN
jgi:hypothetical protein